LPAGFVWGEQHGEVLFHPDEAVTGAIHTGSSNASPNSAQRAGSGSGFVPKHYRFRCKPRPAVYRVRSAG
jgi:hypothetical protein